MVTLSFVAASILVLITPGPTNTLLAACGATMGFRRASILPLAEALGYVIAILFFALFADLVRGERAAAVVLRLAAAGWLICSAYRLWRTPFGAGRAVKEVAFRRVLLTTIVNPKAMLVGTVLIPSGAGLAASTWIASFAALSTIAGLAWVMLGSLLPFGVRRHAYKLAAMILGGFSVIAVASAAAS